MSAMLVIVQRNTTTIWSSKLLISSYFGALLFYSFPSVGWLIIINPVVVLHIDDVQGSFSCSFCLARNIFIREDEKKTIYVSLILYLCFFSSFSFVKEKKKIGCALYGLHVLEYILHELLMQRILIYLWGFNFREYQRLINGKWNSLDLIRLDSIVFQGGETLRCYSCRGRKQCAVPWSPVSSTDVKIVNGNDLSDSCVVKIFYQEEWQSHEFLEHFRSPPISVV